MTVSPKNALNAADEAWSETPQSADASSSGIQYRRMSDIKPEPIRWLWLNRIARGKITIIAGNPGLGKSQLTANLAAIVSTGGVFPADGGRCKIGSVVFICAEDDAADTIRPRLDAVGADVSRILILDSVSKPDKSGKMRQRSFTLHDVEKLDQLLALEPNVSLVIIDPITAYMGGIDSHKTSDVRAVLTPLAEMAARRDVAIVCISHLNKGTDTNAMARVTGSLAYIAAARAAYLVAIDNENPDRRLFLPMKNNLAKDHTGLAFTIESHLLAPGLNCSKIVWENGAVHQTADDVLAASISCEDRSELDEAKAFLLDELKNGPIGAIKIKELAKEAGIKERTLMRAKQKLGVVSKKLGKEEGWEWKLPTKDAKDGEECHL